MGTTENIQPTGERVRKAVRWVSDILLSEPGKDRATLIKEAAMRFDLTPAECLYLEKGIDKP